MMPVDETDYTKLLGYAVGDSERMALGNMVGACRARGECNVMWLESFAWLRLFDIS